MRSLAAVLLVLSLSACAGTDAELPANNGEGTDLMKPSPCACEPVPFNSEGYRWLG